MLSEPLLSKILDQFRQLTSAQFDTPSLVQFLVYHTFEMSKRDGFPSADLLPALDVLETQLPASSEILVVERMGDNLVASFWDRDDIQTEVALNMRESHKLADALIQLAHAVVRREV